MQGALGELPFTLSAQGQQKVGQMAIARIYWYNPVNIGDTFVLTNNEGIVICRGRCVVAGQSQWFDFSSLPLSVDGCGAAILVSGQVDVYTA